MFFPTANNKAKKEDTADIDLGNDEFFVYCDEFKYLGTIFTPSLKDDKDINKRIQSVTGAFATLKKILCEKNNFAPTANSNFRCNSNKHSTMGM